MTKNINFSKMNFTDLNKLFIKQMEEFGFDGEDCYSYLWDLLAHISEHLVLGEKIIKSKFTNINYLWDNNIKCVIQKGENNLPIRLFGKSISGHFAYTFLSNDFPNTIEESETKEEKYSEYYDFELLKLDWEPIFRKMDNHDYYCAKDIFKTFKQIIKKTELDYKI